MFIARILSIYLTQRDVVLVIVWELNPQVLSFGQVFITIKFFLSDPYEYLILKFKIIKESKGTP